jgi:hypothetical protein
LRHAIDNAQHHELVVAHYGRSAIDESDLLVPASCCDVRKAIEVGVVGHRWPAFLD